MREATFEDRKAVVSIISQAFYDNKSINYVVKQGKGKLNRIELLIKYSFFCGMTFGKIYVSNDNNAACIVLFPEKRKWNIRKLIWDIRLIFQCIGFFRTPLILRREKLISKNQPIYPFYHLWYLGVKPSAQGKGKGSKMLQELLEKLDDKPIYLETSTESNLPFYFRHDFNIINEINLNYKLFILKNVR